MKKFSVEYIDDDGRWHCTHVMADSPEDARLEAIKLDDHYCKTLTVKEIEANAA